jgi:Mg/Co/Ni transporter MgtE
LGSVERLPYSSGLFTLAGIDSASVSVALILATSASALSPLVLPRRDRDGPLTVERALDAADPFAAADEGEGRDFL